MVSIGQMNEGSNLLPRLLLFGGIAALLFWLGTLKPQVPPAGSGLAVVHQGSNMSFEPQNQNVAASWSAGSTNIIAAGTNVSGN